MLLCCCCVVVVLRCVLELLCVLLYCCVVVVLCNCVVVYGCCYCCVVVLAGFHFGTGRRRCWGEHLVRGAHEHYCVALRLVTGQTRWCVAPHSIHEQLPKLHAQVDALRMLGYTFLYSMSLSDLMGQHRMFPSLVKIVIAAPGIIDECFGAPSCVRDPQTPLGVPLWRGRSWI